MKESRPRLKNFLIRIEKIMELNSWLTFLLLWVLPLVHYSWLPEERQYRLATRFIRYLKLATIFVFAMIVFATIQSANNENIGNTPLITPLIIGVVYFPLIFYIIVSSKNK